MGYLFTVASFIAFLSASSLVQAADNMDLLQFTCRPEYDLFSVRTMNMEYGAYYSKRGGVLKENPNDKSTQEQAEKQGIYTARALKKKPYVCELDNRVVSVEIANYESFNGSECTVQPTFDVQISVDGEPTYTFSAFGNPRCRSNETHLVTIKDQLMTDCKLPPPISGGTGECLTTMSPQQLKKRM